MRSHYLLLCIALCITANTFVIEAKTVFRRTDKISENFKKLDLPAEEVDPNVAPPEPQKVETIDPDDASDVSVGTVATALADEVIDEADETASAVAAVANDVVDEAANEIESAVQPAVAPAASAASAASASSASSAAVTSAPAAAETTPIKNQDDLSPINRYCKCADNHCDCCRNFGLPLIPVRGPGCAKITYLGNERMSVSIKYGDVTLATRTISSKRARPICVGLPGGYSKFCGRVYGLSKAKDDFKACLGFELRAEDEVEAALRVSCFKFGPEGLRVADPEPLPSEVIKDEEDDDDIFGFAAGGDDEDDDYDDEEDDEAEEADEADEVDEEDEPEENDDDEAEAEAPGDADYGGFSLGGLLDELDDDDDETAKPSAAATPVAAAVVPAAGSTRTAVQSKDDKGTEAAAIAAAAAEEASGIVEAAITPAPAAAAATADGATTIKSKKSKKAKKNKKKKTATTEDGFAYQLLNGILDFFN